MARDNERTDDFIEKLVAVNRVAKVVKGGRQFGFTALTVVGDGNGKVGFGYGKAREVPLAIQKAMEKARRDMKQISLNQGTLWGLAGLSFVAVYREVFETILFYQALWAQTDAASKPYVLAGFGSGIAALLVVGVLVLRTSKRLPLRQFFGATSILMLVLALIFAGKGVVALQEAGVLPMTRVEFPEVALLGLYPFLEGLLLQLGLVLLARTTFASSPRRAVAEGPLA